MPFLTFGRFRTVPLRQDAMLRLGHKVEATVLIAALVA